MDIPINEMLNNDTNKICALPDSVLCRILSFLNMIEVVSTSLISRRWRYLWLSVPVLDFDYDMWVDIHANTSEEFWKEGFMNFVDQVLFLRNGSKVRKLQISCSFCDSDRVVAWLTVAARREFQEIHLSVRPEKPMELPDLLFTSAITVFNLHMFDKYPFNLHLIKLPDSVSSSPHLKTLWLDRVQFPKGNLNGEFILSCPVLENLTLSNCDLRHLSALILSAPRLRSLVVENLDRDWVGLCQIKIWTPNIISLVYTGCWYGKSSLMNYSSLVKASIGFLDEQLDAPDLVELLGAVACAKTIELHSVDFIYKLNNLTSQFVNLRCLTLVNGKLCTRVLAQLLKNAPFIETLLLTCSLFLDDLAHELEDYEEVVPFKCSHLKSVEIRMLKECKLKYLIFLLKSAPFIETLLLAAYGLEDYEEVVPFKCSHLKSVEIRMLKGCKLKYLIFLLKNAPFIETLLFYARELEDYEEVVPFKCSHLKSVEIRMLKGCKLKYLSFLLRNAPFIESLLLNAQEMEDYEEVVPFKCSHLKSVELDMGQGCKLKYLYFLLKNAPFIETLLLDAYELEDFEEVVSFKCSHLTSVEIGRLKGCELSFLKFLLKNAVVLEKLKITMWDDSSAAVREKLGRTILSLPRTSASTIVRIE